MTGRDPIERAAVRDDETASRCCAGCAGSRRAGMAAFCVRRWVDSRCSTGVLFHCSPRGSTVAAAAEAATAGEGEIGGKKRKENRK